MSRKRRADTELNRNNWDEEYEKQEIGVFKEASTENLKNRVIKSAKRRLTSVESGASDSEQKPLFSDFASDFQSKTPFSFSFSFTNEKKNSDKTSSMSGDSNSNPHLSSLKTSSISMINSAANLPSGDSLKNQNKLENQGNGLKTASDNTGIIIVAASKEKTPDEIFRQKVTSLNLLCVEWIVKHLNEDSCCILTPIFDDYKKYVTQLRNDLNKALNDNRIKPENNDSLPAKSPVLQSTLEKYETTPILKESLPNIPVSSNSDSFSRGGEEESLLFSKKDSKTSCKLTKPSEKLSEFSFHNSFAQNKTTPMHNFSSATNTSQNTFMFGAGEPKSSQSVTSSGFNTYPNSNLFKFGAKNSNSDPSHSLGKPFETDLSSKPTSKSSPAPTSGFFSQQIVTKSSESVAETDPTNSTQDDEHPPAVEDAAVTEEGSVYNKKCKIFIKKDGNFVDHGVGFLFLKLVGIEKKCQVIVRANNKLANIIINVLLTSSVPVKKMEKNNIMLICCPTPEVLKPTPVLIKVKTADDAEELIETLNNYKK